MHKQIITKLFIVIILLLLTIIATYSVTRSIYTRICQEDEINIDGTCHAIDNLTYSPGEGWTNK
jgi:hypothetical protein